MRLHTNEIATPTTIHAATLRLPGVYATITRHASRSHKYAYEVRLEGNAYAVTHQDGPGATWDEWGAVIAALYEIDPEALWGSVKRPTYKDKEAFDWQTGHRFTNPGLPDDTHKRHNWKPSATSPRRQHCATCTAERMFA